MLDLSLCKGLLYEAVTVQLEEAFSKKVKEVLTNLTREIIIIPRLVFGKTVFLQPSGRNGWIYIDIDKTEKTYKWHSVISSGLQGLGDKS